MNKDGIVACKRREEDRVLYKYNAIVLPQLYQTELLFRSHDQMGHQGIDKVYQRILKRFEWPGMKKACEKWVTACLSCQQVKNPRKLRFPLQSIESSEFNEVVQIDHQKICMTDNGYNQVLVMKDHFTKYVEAVPCITASAEETCDHLINTWIARHGCPMTFQSDNGTAFVGELTKELMRRSQVAQAHSTKYNAIGHPELPVEKAAEIKFLSREDPFPLDLLLRSNLVQQELSRMNINSLSLQTERTGEQQAKENRHLRGPG